MNQGLVNLVNGGVAKRVPAAFVTGRFFETLGVRPKIGRSIDPSDDEPGRGKVVVISDALWHDRFSANRDAIGNVLVLNRQKYTVIGVMPSSFGYPFEGDIPYGTAGLGRTQMWIPLAVDTAQKTDRRNMEVGDAVIGRLRSNVSVEQTQSELTVIEKRLVVLYPEGPMRGLQVLVAPFVETILGPVSKMLWLLMAAVGLVLIIACGNIANLLLSRLTGRLTEIGPSCWPRSRTRTNCSADAY